MSALPEVVLYDKLSVCNRSGADGQTCILLTTTLAVSTYGDLSRPEVWQGVQHDVSDDFPRLVSFRIWMAELHCLVR